MWSGTTRCRTYIPGNTVQREYLQPDLFHKLDKAQDDVERAKVQLLPYKSIVGALLYASVMAHPEIAYHTSVLAKFLADPSIKCYDAAIQCMQYLACNRKKKIHYSGNLNF